MIRFPFTDRYAAFAGTQNTGGPGSTRLPSAERSLSSTLVYVDDDVDLHDHSTDTDLDGTATGP